MPPYLPLPPLSQSRYPNSINEINTAVKTGVPVPEAAGAKYATALYHWAQFNGLENFSHQFYPLRGMKSGNKKDAFIDLDFGDPKPIRDVVHDFGAAKVPSSCPQHSVCFFLELVFLFAFLCVCVCVRGGGSVAPSS